MKFVNDDKLIFEKSSKGRTGVEPTSFDIPEVNPTDVLKSKYIRGDIEGFPEVSELDTVRHFTNLSKKNFSIDSGFYPLGSCTMKYNPKINEDIARLAGFTRLHPYQPVELTQGALKVMYDLQDYLAEVSGMEAITLQPAAGAQGELCGMLMIGSYFKNKGEHRHKVIVPDTSHGTNPASSALAGFSIITVKSDENGVMKAEDIKEVMDEDVAALMITNPNTLGLFEGNIKEIADIVHAKGGFVYCDGANMNALMGVMKVGDMGVDLIQFNLHKTFSTPHGGGGPGSGPVGVKEKLIPYLPIPRIERQIDSDNKDSYTLTTDRPLSIGRLKAFYGNFLVLVRAYAYIRRLGREGLQAVSEMAILNANYIKEKLKTTYDLPFDTTCMHECVFTDKNLADTGTTTMDVAKRLIDYGYHPPTIYFPLIVQGALMVEPTESESLETLDGFIEAMKSIAKEAKENPELLKNAPSSTAISRVDETQAARKPYLRWEP